MKTRHIEIIRGQLGVGFTEISRYNSEHKDEIENIWEIFYLKGDSKEKVLALLYMFSSGSDDDAIRKYREQTGLSNEKYLAVTLLERYKVPLLSALVYNEAFYAMSVNFRSSVEAGDAIEEVDKDAIISSPTEASRSDFSPVRSRRRSPVYPKRTVVGVAAAAGFVIILSVMLLFKFFNAGLGPQISNNWISDLIEPNKTFDQIAYISEDMGIRIGIPSPLAPKPKGVIKELNNTTATIKYYTKAINDDKNNAELYINRGIAYTLDGYIEAAIKDFNKAIEIDPENPSAYYNRAIAYAGKDDGFDAAIADLIIVLENNPEDNDVYYAIGVLYYWQYEKDKTAASLDMAIDVFEHIPNYKDTNDMLEYLYGLK